MRKVLLSVLLLGLLAISSHPVWAQTMRSQDYEIQMGNINMTSGTKSSDNFTVSDTVGQTASGLYESAGFSLGAGFWYITSVIPFSFSISDLTIDFGVLTASSPQTLNNILTISAGGAGGYQIMAAENHPLQSASSNYIYDVLGDNSDISEEVAGVWNQSSTYGFGFMVSGDSAASDFSDPLCSPNCYRQFADPTASPSEDAQVIAESADVTDETQLTVTYKINISGTQEAGYYQNEITFIAIPRY